MGTMKLKLYEKIMSRNALPAVFIIPFAVFLFYLIYGFNSIRWLDQCVLNYFYNDAILKRDTIFFSSAFFSKYNPYFYLHRIIILLTTTFKIQDYKIIAKVIFFISTVFSLWGLFKISRLFLLTNFFFLLLLLMYVLNVNQIDVGGYSLIRATFYPGLIGMPILIFTIYYFLKEQYNIVLVLLGLLFWIHFPTAFNFITIFLCFFVISRKFHKLSQHVIGMVSLIFLLLPYIFLVSKQMSLSMGQNLPEWGNYLPKLMSYGHVSAYYLFHNLGKERIVFIFINVICLIYTSYYYRYQKENEIFKKLLVLLFIIISLYVGYVIIVEILDIFFFARFQYLRIGWYFSFFYIFFLVYGLQMLYVKRFRFLKGLRDKIFFLCLITMLTATLFNIAYRMVLTEGNESDKQAKYWKEICVAANKTPGNSVFLVPYLKIDFYRYANRLSVFNRYYAGFLVTNHIIFNEIKERYDDFIDKDFLEEYVGDVKKNPNKVGVLWKGTIESKWVNLDVDRIMLLKEKYKITHLIRERVLPLDLPILHQNKMYNIYYIP